MLYFTHLAGFMALAVCGPIVLFSHVSRLRQAERCSLFALPAVAVALYWFASTFGEKELSAQLPTAGDAVVLVVREGRLALYKKVQR